MSGPFGSSQWMYATGVGVEAGQSLRFEKGSSAYLSWTPASAGNRKTWTWSGWVKRGNLGNFHSLFAATTEFASGNSDCYVALYNDQLLINQYTYPSGTNWSLTTNAVFRDVSAWYHIVFTVDTTQATASDRLKLYVNGEQLTSFSSSTYPSQNFEGFINSTYAHKIGNAYIASSSYALDGYLSDVYFIDGQALDPTSFGQSTDGYWEAKDYAGTFGTNGFRLEFDGDTTDSSGNGNDWTANNISAHDYIPDSLQNNFAVLSAVDRKAGGTLSEGNLGYNHNSAVYPIRSTFAANSGKWYWEVRASGNGSEQGLALAAGNLSGSYATYNFARISFFNGNKRLGSAATTSYDTGGGATAGDVYGFAADLDNGDLTVYRNGTSLGSLHTWTPDGTYYAPHMDYSTTSSGVDYYNFGQDSTFAGNRAAGGNTDDNGIGDFAYAPPSGGYLALCTSNLPIPTIVDGTEHFNTVLYTGNGYATTNTQSITGVGFQAGFTWIKHRNGTGSHTLFDEVRGAGKSLRSDTTDAESTQSDSLTSFDSDGFSLGDNSESGAHVNVNSSTYAAWNWKANGTAVSNTDGNVTTQVSANPDAGFSILTWTYTGDGTLGHGLNQAPEFWITKSRNNAYNWWTFTNVIDGSQDYLALNLTNAYTNDTFSTSGATATTIPTDNTFHAGDMVAYVFHSSDVIKVGSYTGNGSSSDGPFVFTGGRVQWMMIKATSTTGNWFIIDDVRDTYNPTNSRLYPNLSNAESDATAFDIFSNGIKIKNNWSDMNSNGVTFIYLAIMETPLKYANAR